MPDLRQPIQSALQGFTTQPIRKASLALLATLGYRSDRTLILEGSNPEAFIDLVKSQGETAKFDKTKALFSDWKSADILFQLTDDDLASTGTLFKETDVRSSLLRSYLFLAIELKGTDYPRGKLSTIARQINRVFPMPVMVFLKHGEKLSIAVINRRQNKIHADKDVLEKVTLIRDIALAETHRGHLDILGSFALENLVHPKKLPITDFDSLHAAWEQVFNVELLNNRFYKELANWYFWALPQVDFPNDLEPDDEKRRATGLIRLLTRLIFCWFLKEKNLIPENLFHPADLTKLLKGFDPESETSSTYYQAILQNLFFATLNQRMGKDGKGNPYRVFAKDEGFQKNKATYDLNNLYRYEKLFAVPEEEAIALFADIPFLNGGLFECLDRTEEETEKKRYLDGFSRNSKKRPHIPDRLFFDSGETADLSEVYGDKKRKAEKVTGLISILNRYKFTINENTPIDQEIALDPELLGKVFENLLASYNEETKTTARKQSGSFYTPRPIVDYMVDESLKAHFSLTLVEKAGMAEEDAHAGLELLFTYTEKEHPFNTAEVAALLAAIDSLKILDPACGSGAFPMGVLHKLVYLLSKLDPDNVEWEKLQVAKVQEITDTEERRRKLAEIASNFTDNNDDYGRKLYLIENCLYGVDIQPIAIQITKLRFFISLVCDQKTNRNKKDNHGIRPLPNLETKFVAANTLIGLPIPEPDLFIKNLIDPIEKEIEQGYHSHFNIQRRDQKITLQKRIKILRQKLSDTLLDGLGANKNSEIAKKAQHLAEWDPFDPQSSADFFDPHWMFGKTLADGFDIVVGNPPYVLLQGANRDDPLIKYFRQCYKVASYKIDLYHLFIERGVNLLKPSGTISLITPTNFASNNFTVPLRRFLLTESHLEKLVFFDEGVFDASVHNVVFVAHKIQPKANATSFYKATMADELLALQIKSEVMQSQLVDDMCLLMVRTGNTAEAVIQKMNLAGETFGSVATVNFGMQLRDRSEFREDVVESPKSKSSLTKFHRECYAGKDVHRYYVSFTERYCYFNREAKRGGCWDEDVHFAKGKILVRQIGSYPEGGLDLRGYAVLNASFMILPRSKDYDSKFLLGVLNSSVVRFYWLNKFKDDRKTFPKIKGEYLKLLPLPKTEQGKQKQIIQSVSRIMAIKEKNPGSDTSDLEHEIDQLVYALYGLTPEEIAIVEGTDK